MVNDKKMKKIRIRSNKDKVISENLKTCKDEYMRKADEDRDRRMMELEKYHNKLTSLREEEKRLKDSIAKLTKQYNRMKSIADGISTEELWNYCSKLNDVSKGKFDDKDKKK